MNSEELSTATNTSYISDKAFYNNETLLGTNRTATNDSYSDDSSFFIVSLPEAIVTITLLSIIAIITCIGNILVIWAILTQKALQQIQNHFLISLAAADLTVSIAVMPLAIASGVGEWHYGVIICQMWLTSDVLLCTSSILNLCVIALDRYMAITKPLWYGDKRTKRFVVTTIIGVWSLSALISVPPILGWNEHTTMDGDTCTVHVRGRGYVVYSALGSFYLPLSVMSYVYYRIYKVAKFRIRSKRGRNGGCYEAHTTVPDETNTTTTFSKLNNVDSGLSDQTNNSSSNSHSPTQKDFPTSPEQLTVAKPTFLEQHRQKAEKISVSRERRAARTLGIIVGGFVLCWLPFFSMYVIMAFCTTCTPPIFHVEGFITWLGYINSTLNPIIYTIFNKDFRNAFKKLIGGLFRRR